MSKYLKDVIEKWSDILDEGNNIMNPKVKQATAIMLENQFNYMTGTNTPGVVSEATTITGGNTDPLGGGYAQNAEFHNIAIPMVRRTFPELIAHEIVGVQPMTGPVGIAFALRFVADQSYNGTAGAEVGYNNVDPYYSGTTATSGGMTTETGEALGSNTVADVGTPPAEYPGIGGGLGVGTGRGIRELSMTVEKAQVEATTRKLRSRWSLEVAQDLKAMHGLSLEEELTDVLAYEITSEIDREIIGKIRVAGAANAASAVWSYSAADGRWEAEKARNFYNMIIRKANTIAISTRRGAGNFLVASPTLSAFLETTASFAIQPVNTNISTSTTGVARVGSLDGRLNVYRDTFATSEELTIGYKGASPFDSGIIYLPYIQMMVSKAQFEDSFNPTVGLMSRYGLMDQMFGASNYYVNLGATNLP